MAQPTDQHDVVACVEARRVMTNVPSGGVCRKLHPSTTPCRCERLCGHTLGYDPTPQITAYWQEVYDIHQATTPMRHNRFGVSLLFWLVIALSVLLGFLMNLKRAFYGGTIWL